MSQNNSGKSQPKQGVDHPGRSVSGAAQASQRPSQAGKPETAPKSEPAQQAKAQATAPARGQTPVKAQPAAKEAGQQDPQAKQTATVKGQGQAQETQRKVESKSPAQASKTAQDNPAKAAKRKQGQQAASMGATVAAASKDKPKVEAKPAAAAATLKPIKPEQVRRAGAPRTAASSSSESIPQVAASLKGRQETSAHPRSSASPTARPAASSPTV